MTTDPREFIIEQRLAEIKRIIAVSGWKGGVGKSSVSCLLALNLAKLGFKTGLFDLDFTGACDHVILGADNAFPTEVAGLEPPVVHGVHFMSAALFSKRHAVSLRGQDVSQAMLELLAVTQWRELDFLILDMPPGIGDANFDVLRWVRRAEFLAVTTPSVLSREITARSLSLMADTGAHMAGVIENMHSSACLSADKNVLACAAFDPAYEAAIGDPEKLLATSFAQDIKKAALKL